MATAPLALTEKKTRALTVRRQFDSRDAIFTVLLLEHSAGEESEEAEEAEEADGSPP